MATEVTRRLRARGMDQVIGERVHTLMWQQRLTNAAMARELTLDPATFSRRLRGERGWTADEVFWLAGRLGVGLNVLYGLDPIPATDAQKAPTREGEGQKLPDLDSNQEPAGTSRDGSNVILFPSRRVPKIEQPAASA